MPHKQHLTLKSYEKEEIYYLLPSSTLPSPEAVQGSVQVVCSLTKGPSPGHTVGPVGPEGPKVTLWVPEGIQGRAHLRERERERGKLTII